MEIPTKLNIGCGKDSKPGYYNVDLIKFDGVDKVLDLDKFPYDLPSDHFDEIYCKSVLQCVKNPTEVVSEFHRLLKKGGRLYFDVPHFSSKNCWKDITHRRGYAFHSFDIFMDNNFYVSGAKVSFSRMKRKLFFGKKYAIWNYLIEPLANKYPNLYEDTCLRALFPGLVLKIEFIK
ncbi:methyltransferase domain-containing protein [Candidatus Woesearchaeota archaeon]|jgi:SAM-dependent methyltransferase|nr:methyltransferase domain-containing protein [Candidatus Woesearchaeota archaeon]MBT4322114.1 methyltransferase domain-containing protein [Candidatus Woesearchaeota archaeon]MBT4630691.1 methyltransferase domain-containing protein [Candidatus Woesearchaeota archaeon]